jgi:anaerobic magnesium-protoporphyrin IX monomethyl ester cyclase
MKRILLISPPVRNQRMVDLIPAGLLSIAGYLRKHAFAVKVYNSGFPAQTTYEKKIENTINLIKNYTPDFIGIGFPSDALDSATTIARMAKGMNRNISVIVGGIHPSARPTETINIQDFDFLVHGEGEVTTRDLLHAVTTRRDLRSVMGISFRKNGTVITTEPRPEIKDLDDIPFDNRDLLIDVEKYAKGALGQIHTSRGCPYECAYCSSSIVWKRRVRYRSAASVTGEIAYLNSQYRVKDINFADDNFTLDHDRVTAVCEEILKKKLKVNWRCCARSDIHKNFSPEILKFMRKAGCKQICIGFESGNQAILDKVARGVKIADSDKMLQAMKDARIRLHVDFLIGLPGETGETLSQTLRLMKKAWHVCRPTMNVSLFKPYPGTHAYETMEYVDHSGLYPQFKKIFGFAEACNIKKLSRDPAYIGRRLLDNISAPRNLGLLIRKTFVVLRNT